MPVSVHWGLSGGVLIGLISQKIFRQASSVFFLTLTRLFGAFPFPLGHCCLSRICLCCP